MADRPELVPDADHPITIAPSESRVRVIVGGRVVADTKDALALREASYPPVFYVPRQDVDMAAFEKTKRSTYCPYKGEAGYFDIGDGGDGAKNAAWSYETPHAFVLAIRDHIAFYPDRVDAIEVTPA